MGKGGGGDGGVIATKRYLLKTKDEEHKARAKLPDAASMAASRMNSCALTGEPLRDPIVVDELGNLFNKEALLMWYLEQKSSAGGTASSSFPHIKNVKKDVIAVKSTRNPAAGASADAPQFICPVTQTGTNGKHPFVVLRRCGCLVSDRAVRGLAAECCPACTTPLQEGSWDVIRVAPTPEETAALMERLEKHQAAAKAAKATTSSSGGAGSSSSNSGSGGGAGAANTSSDVAAVVADGPSSSSSSSSSAANGKGLAGVKRPRPSEGESEGEREGAAADGHHSGHHRGGGTAAAAPVADSSQQPASKAPRLSSSSSSAASHSQSQAHGQTYKRPGHGGDSAGVGAGAGAGAGAGVSNSAARSTAAAVERAVAEGKARSAVYASLFHGGSSSSSAGAGGSGSSSSGKGGAGMGATRSAADLFMAR